jgi:SAM-dependent methyltransferase/uncharacterized protein YbaR (Trm112 family)
MIDRRLLEVLRCPCGGRVAVAADATGETPEPGTRGDCEPAGLVCASCGTVTGVRNGIPRFATLADEGQTQVQGTFAYKWKRTPEWGITGATAEIMTGWVMATLGWKDEAAYAAALKPARLILDAGCGNGRETIRLARLNPEALVIGLDISEAVDEAARNAAGLPNIGFVQADLCAAPLARGVFDQILSFGVLHHTPDTRRAFLALVPLLSRQGEFTFYVYRKKAPLREFSDDYLRSAIRAMTPADAWDEMTRLTLFGKALADLKAEIEVPAIPTLGIMAGRHDVQRLLYYTVIKCYWRDGWSLEENTHINFDWFYPQYAWRHTSEEVRSWIREAGLSERSASESPAALTFRVGR